jgi:hypothetical protein
MKLKFPICLFFIFVAFEFPIKSQTIAMPLIFQDGYNRSPSSALRGKVRKVGITSSINGQKLENTVNEYSRSGVLVSSTEYFAGENPDFGNTLSGISGRELYDYSSGKRALTKISYHNREGASGLSTKFFYDDENQINRELFLDSDQKIKHERVFTFDTAEKKITMKSTHHYESETTVITDLFFYDDNGKIIKRVNLDEQNKPKETTDFEYDSRGNVTTELVGQYVYTYRYRFNKKLNWVKRIQYFRLKSEDKSEMQEHIVTIRKIQYY